MTIDNNQEAVNAVRNMFHSLENRTRSLYNYGYKDGYFDSIVEKIEAVDKTAFADLVANVRKAEALAADALYDLESGNYTYEYKYVEKFGTEDYIYTLNNGKELQSRMNEIYSEFSNWLGSWEM